MSESALTPESSLPSVSPLPVPVLKAIVVHESAKEGLWICQQLRAMGHQTKYVESGIKAINAVSMYGCDLLIVDYELPLLDGAETAELLIKCRRGGPKIEIIGLVDLPDKDKQERCVKAGMRYILLKPLEEEALRTAVGKIEMRLAR